MPLLMYLNETFNEKEFKIFSQKPEIPDSSFQIINLDACTTYELQIATRCSDVLTSTWTSFIFETDICPAPLSLYVSKIVADESLSIQWGAIPGISNYQVAYRANPSDPWIIYDVDTNYVLLDDLISETEYEFKVRANCCEDSFSDWSKTITITLPGTDCYLSSQVLFTSIIPDPTSLFIQWELLSAAIGYELSWWDLNDEGNISSMNFGATETTYLISGLNPATTYGLTISALCESEITTIESETTATTLATPKLEKLDQQENDLFSIYPNPNKGSFTLHSSSSSDPNLTIIITDLTGKMVFRKNYILDSNQRDLYIECNDLTTGIYLLNCQRGKQMWHAKVTIHKY